MDKAQNKHSLLYTARENICCLIVPRRQDKYSCTNPSFSGEHTNSVVADDRQEELKNKLSPNSGDTGSEVDFMEMWALSGRPSYSELAPIVGTSFPETASFENYSFDLSIALFWTALR